MPVGRINCGWFQMAVGALISVFGSEVNGEPALELKRMLLNREGCELNLRYFWETFC